MKPETDHRRRRMRVRIACLTLGRKLIALLLCFFICLSLLPMQYAAETTEPDSPPSSSSSGTPAASVTERTVSRSDETPISSGASTSNTYMLEVSTGSVRGGGTADNVKYFVIYYTTGTADDLKTRSAVIFPGKDGMQTGMNIASAVGNRNTRRQQVENIFGYTTQDLENRKGLGSVHTDQYIFTTPDKIYSIDRIQIFGRLEETTGSDGKPKLSPSAWACQGMHISRVDKIYGLEMYGWYSNEGYIDYKGEIIADVVMAPGGGIFYWNSNAGVFNITGPGSSVGVTGLTLVNTRNAQSSGKESYVGTQHDSQVTNRIVLRIDLADIGGGGFECLSASYETGSEPTISSLKLCETAAIQIYYRDVYNCIREVSLPLIVNSLGWTMEKLGNGNISSGDVSIAGFAQQGDSIALSLMLPDFKELTSVEDPNGITAAIDLSIGENLARSKAHLQTASGADTSLRASRVAAADKEIVSYLCVAAYRDVGVKIEHDSATLRYSYTPGAQEPGSSIVAGSVEGVDLDAGTANVLPMVNYREGMKLLPKDSRKYYLVTITTDNVSNAGTTKDISLQFKYLNMSDKEVTTNPLRLRDYVNQFYGDWPGNVSSFAYNLGFRTGGTVQMLIPINDVKQFRTVSVKMDGADEWQFKGIWIQFVTSYSSRILRWEEIDREWTSGQNLKSHLSVTRNIAALEPCFKCGMVYENPDDAPDPLDPNSDWKPGNLVQDDGKYHEFDGNSYEVSEEEPFDWSDYRYYMTYEDTLQDLGFTKERCLYRVTVKVAGNKVNAGNDDCGSANLFYFQLIFENGKSGCVLANQQLHADAFRTGEEAQFDIPTTQDYGDLTSVRIIPDDQDSNSDIYDKLKIDYIKVKKQNTGKISPTWTADSDSEDGLGWVGIDYRDPGAAGSNRGTEGRSISEIAHTFEITKTSYSAKLLFSISTGSYGSQAQTNAYGETFIVNNPVLECGMSMSYDYYDQNGGTHAIAPVDIIQLMNDYSGLEDNYTRTINGVTETMDFCVSKPEYQFRPGTQDKFFVDVDDIYSLSKMQLQIRSSVRTFWTIDNISVYLVQSSGSRYINRNGEYDFKYPDGQGLSLQCTWNRPQSLTKDIQTYKPPSTLNPESQIVGSSIVTIDIGFNENEFPMGDESWTSTVTREPSSKNDSLNLFIYPSTENTAADPNRYSLLSEVMYTDTINQSALRIDTGKMSLSKDASGRPVFYALGLTANYFESLAGVNVYTDSVQPIHVPLSYGVLQRVRDGVLIDSYYLIGSGNADLGLTMRATENPAGQSVQRLFLQIDNDTPTQKLISEETDLAAAIYFISDGPNERELRTKYIYLTDQGYSLIHPGEVLELDFCLDNVKEITGINLVCMGRIDVGLVNGEILEQDGSGTVIGKWSFRGGMSPSRTPARFGVTGLVTLLDLDISTALSDMTVNSGTSGPIRMTIGYLDHTGNLMTQTFENIRNYLDYTECFQAGSSDSLRLLVPDLTELRWVELEPLSESGAAVAAAWKVDSLSAMLDLSGIRVSRVVNQLIVEGEPLRISLADILLAGTVSIIHSPEETGNVAGDFVIPTGGNLDLALNVGEGIRIVPKMQGSTEGVDVTLERTDPATGAVSRAELMDTRGYTPELLEEYALAAEEDGRFEEAAIWRSVVPDNGTWEVTETYDPVSDTTTTNSVVLVPPHNYTDSVITYRITLSSRENGAATVYINISVPPEPDPVQQLLEEAAEQDNHEHTLTFIPATAPSCVASGQQECYQCSICGKYFSDADGQIEVPLTSLVIPATGIHTFTTYSPVSGGHVGICSVCRAEGEVEAHVYGAYTYTDANHTYSCTVCGENVTEAHFFQSVVTEPTETQQGYTTHTCVVCGYRYTDSFTQPLGTGYNVHFSVPDGVDAPADMISYSNYGITLPTVTAPEGYKFLGWVTEEITYVDERPDTVLNGSYTATKDITLYALFSCITNPTGETGYSLVTVNLSDWSGRYVITSKKTTALYAMKGLAKDKDYWSAGNSGQAFYDDTGMILDNETLRNVGNAYVFEIRKTNSGNYTLRSIDKNTYVFNTGSALRTSASYSSLCDWTISLESHGYAEFKFMGSSDTPYLSFDTNQSGSQTNAFYAGNRVTAIYLWEQTEIGDNHYTTVISDGYLSAEPPEVTEAVGEGENISPNADSPGEGPAAVNTAHRQPRTSEVL